MPDTFAEVVTLLKEIVYLLQGPDQVYADEITATTTENQLAFRDFKIRSISLLNSGSVSVQITFNAPAYRGGTPKKSATPTYTLVAGASLNLTFMEKADEMRYMCAAGTTTIEVFAMLKIAKTSKGAQ